MLDHNVAFKQEYTLNNLKARSVFTPDVHDIEMYDNHLVLVWNNCKYGGFEYAYTVAHSSYLGRGVTYEDDFYMKSSYQQPFVTEATGIKSDNVLYSRLSGEVYAVSTAALIRLDNHMQNNVYYVREKKYVFLLDQKSPLADGKPFTQLCWIYLMPQEIFEEKSRSFPPSIKRNVHEIGGKWAWDWTPRERRIDN